MIFHNKTTYPMSVLHEILNNLFSIKIKDNNASVFDIGTCIMTNLCSFSGKNIFVERFYVIPYHPSTTL